MMIKRILKGVILFLLIKINYIVVWIWFGFGTDNMYVYSLANPSLVLLRKLFQDVPSINYVHDMFVRNDTIYASCGGQGLQILLLTASNTFSLISSYTDYQYNGYNHSSWVTDNRKTLVFADEAPSGLPGKTIDVSNLGNIASLDIFKSHTLATAHNPYIIGNNWCWMTYQDGLYLYDISNPNITTMYGFFDTCPLHGVLMIIFRLMHIGEIGLTLIYRVEL